MNYRYNHAHTMYKRALHKLKSTKHNNTFLFLYIIFQFNHGVKQHLETSQRLLNNIIHLVCSGTCLDINAINKISLHGWDIVYNLLLANFKMFTKHDLQISIPSYICIIQYVHKIFICTVCINEHSETYSP
jgi:hypothetical protein